MQENLVIVESPAKAKKIESFLGKDFKVMSSYGHIRDLKKKEISIDPDTLMPIYEIPEEKKRIVAELKANAKKAKKVWLASDEDREGEAISWHLCEVLGLDEKKTSRIVFHEITKNAILDAIEHPRHLDMNLANAQQARRVLDRLVGFNLSPVLWRKVKPLLSAGRVQSVATRLIVEREREVQAFKPEPYYRVTAIFALPDANGNMCEFHAELDHRFNTHEEAVAFLEKCRDAQFTIEAITKKPLHRQPAAPFTTSTLQQEAARKLGFAVTQTMMVAQQLYEGVEIKGMGTVGLVTYIRTDSVRISQEARAAARSYIEKNFGKQYAADNIYTNKKKDIQDAHEAIRPSRIDIDPEAIKDSLTKDQYSLYKLIWSRFLSSQMAAAVFDGMQVTIENGPYNLKASGSKLIFDGYQKVYSPNFDEDKDKLLPELTEGEELKAEDITSEQKFTEPPSRFTEASLVKDLEEKNIGRPSTYAPIIATLLDRKYIKREKKTLLPTDLGFLVTELMEQYFTEIVDAGFTAEMEDKLDDIEAKDLNWKQVVREFYGPLKEELEVADKAIEKVKLEDTLSGDICELCGRPMAIKTGRFGEFLACTGYPECKNTKAIVKSINVKCPDCGGDIVAKRGRSGKIFYGCSNYPDCKRAFWYKPTNRKCPQCGQLLLEKHTKNTKYVCSNDKCGYRE